MYIEAKSFASARLHLEDALCRVHVPNKTEKWQGRNTDNKPDLATHELINVTMQVHLTPVVPLRKLDTPDLIDHWKHDIKPHLPWADDHFAERVGGEPLNPGNTWHTWRHAASAETFLEGGQKRFFNHTYMERLWPKYARKGEVDSTDANAHHGIGWSYGDLRDLVDLLAQQPHTRQAYIPLFFPEDTGVGDNGRKPCTLGYQFLMRDDQLHIYYPMRSCDFANHWADDCYLAVRLGLWIIEECQRRRPERWSSVRLGTLTMHCVSLHIFRNDWLQMCRHRNGV